ncbi:hypothetical protein AJ78_07454 [Emergomyces pasteurianus Ep9510]|uniref:Major facilitator superfamily (MFS) profile domain-containing protein n=1 Tax=Emergomyces pasteurianus Ep9510 TaxID=1447872 RepID=A0A1J9PVG2_9EURO|nr:hypothetical protein AJ78_07454 [Emergomyces pasteurianus Ep9510]
MGPSSNHIDYTEVRLENKWKILRAQWRYGLWAFWTSIGSMMLGMDYVAGGQLAALPEFKKQFGVQYSDGSWIVSAKYLSAWAAIGPACDIVAVIIAAPYFEKYGRKPPILAAAVISTVGVLLQQLATEWKMHLAGRAVNGAAIGIMFTISPLWIGETCRPELRGFFLAFFNTSIVLGQFAIVVIAYISSNIVGKWQWWTVVVAMYIFPLFLTVVYPWFPESPYWLVRQNRLQEANRCLRTMYGVDDDVFYEIEMRRIQEDVELTSHIVPTARGPYGLPNISAELECFKGKNLKRTMTAIFAASGQQLIGATFVTGYATYFLELIHISNFFLVSSILYVVMLMASSATFYLVEVAGRRTLIVPSLFILCIILLIIGVMGCIPNQVVAGWVIVVLIFIWAIVYQLSIGATGFILASEVATMRLRSVTQSLVTVSNAVWGLVMQFTIPYMINRDAGNLGGKTGFIFLGTGLVTAIVGFFLFPETKGLTFEKLDELYEAGISPRQFRKYCRDNFRDNPESGKEVEGTRISPVDSVESERKGT